jgi:hypothetical protein
MARGHNGGLTKATAATDPFLWIVLWSQIRPPPWDTAFHPIHSCHHSRHVSLSDRDQEIEGPAWPPATSVWIEDQKSEGWEKAKPNNKRMHAVTVQRGVEDGWGRRTVLTVSGIESGRCWHEAGSGDENGLGNAGIAVRRQVGGEKSFSVFRR